MQSVLSAKILPWYQQQKKTTRERITGVRQNGCGKATEGLQRSRFLRWVALIKVY